MLRSYNIRQNTEELEGVSLVLKHDKLLFDLSWWFDSFPDAEVTDYPAQKKASSQVPADATQLFNSSGQAQDSPPERDIAYVDQSFIL